MKRFVNGIAVAVLGMLTTEFAIAQQPTQVQKTPTTGYVGPINQAPWFSNPAVRQQLNMNDAQFSQLNKIHADAWTRYQQGLKIMTESNLPPDQRSQRMQELQSNYYKSFSTPVNEVFKDEQMRSRYNQLHMQYRGYDALLDPTVQAKLTLTDAQRQKLSQYQEEWRKSMGDLGRDYQMDPQGALRRFEEMRRRDAERTDSVLSEQQRQMWRGIVGNPYNFQPSVYFPSTIPPSGR